MSTPSQPPPAPEPKSSEPLTQRVDALESGQSTIEGKIDQILGIIGSKPEGDPPVTSADPPPAADVGEQMRQAVRDVHAEQATAAAAKAKPEPEVTPREAGQPFRDRLARTLYGKEPKRT